MKRSLIVLFALLLAIPAFAERKHSAGEYEVHYNVFNSGFLQPDIAAAAGLTRSKTQGVMNIAVLKAGKPVPAKVSGTMHNLLSQRHVLKFSPLKEGEAIYYLAQFPLEAQETLRFNVNVQPEGGAPIDFEFSQELFPGQ